MFTRLSRLTIAVVLLATALVAVPAALAVPPGNPQFLAVWDRTDGPVLDGLTSRTWMWGPEANSGLRWEPYQESGQPGRVTQYFDKSRMEITNPGAVDDGLWYVTNGLLVVELITGRMQIGNDLFVQLEPAAVNVAGDSDDPQGPTYATFLELLDADAAPVGAPIVNRVGRDGSVQADPSLAGQGVTAAIIDDVTGHAIASPFWEFMQSSGLVRTQVGLVNQQLFINPYYATGRPIAEPYWANVKIANTYRDVLMQCFERRCVTYTPANPPGWQVEAGNVGQHYDTWRNNSGYEYAIEWIDASQGGTLVLNETTVAIPPDALEYDTLSTLVPAYGSPALSEAMPAYVPPALPDGYAWIAGSHLTWNPVAILSVGVEVRYEYDEARIPDDVGLNDLIAIRKDSGNGWTPVESWVVGNALVFELEGASEWVVAYLDTSGANTAPVADDVSTSATPSVPQDITLSASDPDNDLYSDNLTFEIVDGPTHGTLDTSTPSGSCQPAVVGVECTAVVSYTAAFGYTGMDSFTYRASDGDADSALAAVTITVSYPASQQHVVDAEDGGTIEWAGLIVLIFPPGSITCDAYVTISPGPPVTTRSDAPASNSIDVELTAYNPSHPDCDNGEVHIIEEITIGLYYDPEAIPDGSTQSDLYLARSQSLGTWEELPQEWFDPNQPIIYGETLEFSKWNVFVG